VRKKNDVDAGAGDRCRRIRRRDRSAVSYVASRTRPKYNPSRRSGCRNERYLRRRVVNKSLEPLYKHQVAAMRAVKWTAVAVTVLWLVGAPLVGLLWMGQEYALIVRDNGDGTVTFQDGPDEAVSTKREFLKDSVKNSLVVVLMCPTAPYLAVMALFGLAWVVARLSQGASVPAGAATDSVGNERGATAQERGRPSRVAAPATALIVVGVLGIVANFLLALGLNAFRPPRGPSERPAGMDDATFQAYERGRAAAPLLDCCLIALPTLVVYPLVIVAGVQMAQLRSRWLAITGAILSMAPCSPAVVLGLPVGIWSLVVLGEPAVRTAFAEQRPRP
jgi:hypothetical protein